MNVDILMPVYNTKPSHLIEAVESILKQTHKQYRLLIINDGSTQADTLNVIEMVKAWSPQIEVHTIEHGGTSEALNYGHSIAKTEFVAITGSDDINHPQRIEKQVQFIAKNKTTDVLGSSIDLFYDDDIYRKAFLTLRKADHPKTHDNQGFLIAHGTSMYKVSVANAIGGYNVKFARGQDVDFFRRLFAAGFQLRNVEEILYRWRRYR